eukprot:8734546-Karenia_brevis.AAC.1
MSIPYYGAQLFEPWTYRLCIWPSPQKVDTTSTILLPQWGIIFPLAFPNLNGSSTALHPNVCPTIPWANCYSAPLST